MKQDANPTPGVVEKGPRKSLPPTQAALRTSREAKPSGANFGPTDTDPGKQTLMTPGDFGAIHGLRVPPRPEIKVTPSKLDPVNAIVKS